MSVLFFLCVHCAFAVIAPLENSRQSSVCHVGFFHKLTG